MLEGRQVEMRKNKNKNKEKPDSQNQVNKILNNPKVLLSPVSSDLCLCKDVHDIHLNSARDGWAGEVGHNSHRYWNSLAASKTRKKMTNALSLGRHPCAIFLLGSCLWQHPELSDEATQVVLMSRILRKMDGP